MIESPIPSNMVPFDHSPTLSNAPMADFTLASITGSRVSEMASCVSCGNILRSADVASYDAIPTPAVSIMGANAAKPRPLNIPAAPAVPSLFAIADPIPSITAPPAVPALFTIADSIPSITAEPFDIERLLVSKMRLDISSNH